MGKKLYVGNLNYRTTEDKLREFFSGFGSVASAKIITDRETGNSKGFGFVEMETDDGAHAALEGSATQALDGRPLKVNEAIERPRTERGFGGRN